ncbi:MAG: nucleoside transporter C-terminal domain-containing protein [Sediminibacterium sp.]|nr:nucleoside transporter C-terminal domain-containing protein [Sediminibacterium sp.]
MKLKRLIPLFGVLMVLALSSCQKREDVASELPKKWTAWQAVTGSLTISEGDTLQLTKTRFELIAKGVRLNGDYTINKADSTLSFTYDLKPLLTQIDSVAYVVKNNHPEVLYYKNGHEITRVDEKGLHSERVVKQFKVKKSTTESLVFSDDKATYSFGYKVQIKEGNMSLKSLLRGLIGILVLTGILFLMSSNRKAINWKLVVGGILFQLVFAVLVLKVPLVASIFDYISNFFVEVLDFTKRGALFVFGDKLMDTSSMGFIFAFQILPTILFFSALTSIFYYLGILQKIVYGLSWLMGKVMKMSGAENLSTSANIFLGQTEAPLMIKHFLPKMNRSEMLCIMVGGMANTAGGVLAAYVGFLGGDDPSQQLFFAKHLLAASIMSAPATIVISKMLIPQTEPIDEKLELNEEKLGTNLLEAISNGTQDGLKLAVNVAAMLIVFIALTYMVNRMLYTVGSWTSLNAWLAGISGGQYKELSLQALFAYPCSIIAYAMGVCKEDMLYVGQLLGEKTVINEFNAYISMGGMKAQNVFHEQKSVIMSTYILSGFANFASIGIQIGGIGALAPNKRSMLSELGIKALIGGTIASLFTATLVGMLI